MEGQSEGRPDFGSSQYLAHMMLEDDTYATPRTHTL